jgi:hypothetical protein
VRLRKCQQTIHTSHIVLGSDANSRSILHTLATIGNSSPATNASAAAAPPVCCQRAVVISDAPLEPAAGADAPAKVTLFNANLYDGGRLVNVLCGGTATCLAPVGYCRSPEPACVYTVLADVTHLTSIGPESASTRLQPLVHRLFNCTKSTIADGDTAEYSVHTKRAKDDSWSEQASTTGTDAAVSPPTDTVRIV